MRIAQIVTYVSRDGAFGGPVAVAVAQSVELARRGHEVTLLAGGDGAVEFAVPGVSVKLFAVRSLPVDGFSGLYSSQLRAFLRENLDDFDVFHIHLARDLITLPTAAQLRRRGRKYVVQTHGMVMPDGRLRARIFDAVATSAVLRRAQAVLTLTDAELAGVRAVARGPIKAVPIANGIAVPNMPTPRRGTMTAEPEVLFLARLHPRKRVMTFALMAELLRSRGVTARFTAIGPDEGDLVNLKGFVARTGALVYEGTIAQGRGIERIAAADVYVLPSFGEVVPMSVLEALAAGTPTVITSDCGIAPELERRGAALITDGSPEQLASAVERLLADPTLRSALAAAGGQVLADTFGISAVADELERTYKTQNVGPPR